MASDELKHCDRLNVFTNRLKVREFKLNGGIVKLTKFDFILI